jgi:CP family cyanate transporter-like MFS transporter
MPDGAKTKLDLSFGVASVCIILVALFLRPGIVAVGPLLPSIREQFGLSHTTASLLTTIPDLVMGLLALPTPWLSRRFGRDRVILAALVLLAAAIVARALAPTMPVLLLTTAGIGAGIAIAGALIAGFVKASFPARAALMMGIYATALSIGSTISAAATGPIARELGGWRYGSGIWAVLGVTAVGAWLLIERRVRRTSAGTPPNKVYALPIANPKAWLVALFFACDNFLFYGCLSWIATLYREHGFSETQAGLILACFTAGFIVSTPLAGALSRREDRRLQLAIWTAITLLGLIPLATIPDALPYLWVTLIALGVGGGFTLGMTLPLDNTEEPAEATAWNAFTLTVGYVIAAGGPLAVGALRDVTGGFAVPLWMLVAVGVFMLALTPLLRPRMNASAR